MTYFNYIDGIESDEAPDYDWLIELFERQLSDEELESQDLCIYDVDHEPDQAQLEAQLFGKVVDGRFQIESFLRYEYGTFAHNGLNSNIKSVNFAFEAFNNAEAICSFYL